MKQKTLIWSVLINCASGIGGVAIAQPMLSDGVIPDGARFKVTYQGTMQGSMTVKDRSKDTHIHVGGFSVNLGGSSKVPLQGVYHANVTYDGSIVRGNEWVEGQSGRMNASANDFQGTRQGDRCDLFGSNGVRFTATCTLGTFEYRSDYTDSRQQKITSQYSARQTALVDIAEQERLAAAAAAKRQLDHATYVARLSPIERSREKIFEQALNADAQTWVSNRLDPYSVRNVKIERHTSSATVIVYGTYTLNGGQPAWMRVALTGQSIRCVEFFDFPGQCRAIGHPASHDFMAKAVGAMVAGMFSDGGSSGSSGAGPCGSSAEECERRSEQVNRDMYRQEPREPVKPISAFYGNGPN